MNGSIICGVDGSESAKRATEVARRLSAELGLRLVFVEVVEPGAHPADRLVAAARTEEARLLVVGSRGPRSSLLGSISAEVSRRASCPVVVVPPGAGDWTSADDGDKEVAGGIVRLGLGAGDGDVGSAGGILRFNLAGRGH